VLASSFTLNAMQTEVRTVDDLRTLQVGALAASTSSAFLRANGIRHQTRPDLDTLVNDLDAGELDAIVSDAAFILVQDSPLRERINRALLSVRMQPEWRDKNLEYLGE
jgi:ABC-type amino acid transport substrate-binding protein